MRTLALAFLTALCGVLAAACSPSGTPAGSAEESPFEYQQVMVPMRDGIRLQTVIMRERGFKGPLPILIVRTPYGVPDKAPEKMPPNLKELAADGYIFVIQNLRGRFKSEGTFTQSSDALLIPGKGTIETLDGWDTIDWLVKNVPENNGRVGILGVSYSGYTAAATLLDPHPALKAVSEQAAGPVDEWMHDDDHRYGALRLSYDFEYAVMEESDKNANAHFAFDRWDTYQWYLGLGPLSNINDLYVHGKVPNWSDTVAHPDYDDYWKSLVWVNALHSSTVPNLNVAGFWDQEDPWGPWEIFRRAAQSDPDGTNLMVAGPWCHGCWNLPAEDKLGPWALGHETAREFRENIEAPFFAFWLHGKGAKPTWRAKMFQTGSNTWQTYPAWPVKTAVATKLYLHADGTLSFQEPKGSEKETARSFVSDPANPVPYRPRPISPTYPGGDWRYWESGDQRFVDDRPDVLTYVTQPLDRDVTVTGEVRALIYASTTGTDSDVVAKLIDVFPEDAEKVDWYTNPKSTGPAPGEYATKLNGYELPIAMEVRRGRYLASYEHPKALTPGVPVRWPIPLRDRDHVFLKGHRIMLQIQSTWFPIIDRNPQTFTPSIYTAKASDYRSATQRVYSSPAMPSHIELPIVPARP
ncbi:MAG: CocE/NonD family hydrolase [Proteobacteria bacterium]|nr:CocE/NonD family hydrolase [Pseudomonadota bacterium]